MGMKMTNTKTQIAAQTKLPKRVSPELAEVLHMLKSLEGHAPAKIEAQIVR
jgi:hypothetical protein